MYLEKSEEKLAVLYTIDKYEAPLGITKLFEIMTWEKQVMEYFELSEILFELMEDKYIEKTFYRNNEAYALTSKGEEALSLFTERIPPAARTRINDAVGKIKFDCVIDPNSVTAEILPTDGNQYSLRCGINENGVPQMELTLNLGSSKLSASLAAENFKENADKIYNEIIKLCLPEKKDNR